MTAQLGPATPRVVGDRYTLVGELGRGGMGIVWRAEDRVIGRHVAVKELRLHEGVSQREREIFQERVIREARSAGRLNDPGIVTVYDVVTASEATYLVMELVEAPTLSELVRTNGPLPPARVIAIGEQMVAALEVAHAAGIVHRDVKPSNIMVLPSGRVKLADFGIAQAMDDPKLTTSGMLVGSPSYMAPERVHGVAASPASDLWAAGAVMFFAVEGRAAYERPTAAATLHAIVSEQPQLTRISGPLASVIMGLLLPVPEARLTAPQVHALLHIPASAGDLTNPMTPPYGHPVRPHPTALSGVAPRGAGSGVRTWLAVAGVVAALVLGYFVGHLAGKDSTPQPLAAMAPTLTFGPGGDLSSFDLTAGQCGNGRVAAGVNGFTTADSVDCGQQHAFEVYADGDAISGSLPVDYPDATQLKKDAEGYCTIVFQSAWITPADKYTDYEYVTLIPSQAEWKSDPSSSTNQSRKIRCVVWHKTGSLSPSVVANAN
jgi:tRNA A-37 threonylcarbamoyl transferase component Bud32